MFALAVSGGDLYAGGHFATAGGSPANFIAKWNGISWSALGSGSRGDGEDGPPYVYALAVSGSELYVGGYFTMTNEAGIAATNIAKWDGSSWSPLGSGLGGGSPNTSVAALAVSGSDLYVGGSFATAGGIAATNIAK
ncbi:MAG: hypothetical protein L0Z50_35535 [Verrucomicrobiales bacterium]|nr:hypothetical protein [Verrucomicrobiales bacterium]